jgi:serine/threonine protein kinase/WD40 repeat protein
MADYLGRQLGNYRLIRLLGAGGFAEVYLGEHIYLKTEAAIKVLHTRLAEDELDHFLDEARTIARLRHPRVVRVLDFGVQGDTPFLVMDYAPNGTLRQRYRRGTWLAPAAMLPHLRQVAEALDYAHEQKLIHRDVKPENMLLDARSEVLLSDFGIALVFHSSRSQTTQEVVGSVAYMAPEQIQGHPRPASDQYALGVVAYEWLSGAHPFSGTFSEVAARHLHMPPPPLRERVPDCAPAVEQVVLTALAKDYRERFPSVRAFADAFEQACQLPSIYVVPTQPGRFPASLAELANEPTFSPPAAQPTNIISPVPPPGAWASPAEATAPTAPPTMSSALPGSRHAPATPAVGVLTPPGAAPAAPAPSQPEKRQPVGISRRAALIGGLAGLAAVGGGISWLFASQRPTSSTPPNRTPAARDVTPGTGAILTTYQASGKVYALAWSPDSTRLVSLSDRNNTAIWRALTGQDLITYQAPTDTFDLYSVAWSPDGQYVVSGDGWGAARVFSTSAASPLYTFETPEPPVFGVAWSRDSARVASAAGNHILVWDALSGQHPQTLAGHTDKVLSLAWSPDGKKIAAGSADHTVMVWDAATGRRLFICQRFNTAGVSAVAWSPDSRHIAAGSLDQTIRLFDGATGQATGSYDGFSGPVHALAWSPDGTRIAWSSDNYVQVAPANLQSTSYAHQGHTDTVYAIAWSPNGTYIASGGADHKALVWVA